MTCTSCFQDRRSCPDGGLLDDLRQLAMRAEVAAFGLHDPESLDQRLAVLLDLFEVIDRHDPELGQRLLRQALPSAITHGDPAWSRLVEASAS